MSVYHCAYLFDVEGYRRAATSISNRLVLNDYDHLQGLANQIALQKPDVWAMLADYRLQPEDLGREEKEFDRTEDRVRFWMRIVLASFWQPIESFPRHGRSIESAMRQTGCGEEVITKVTIGKAICALLQPQLVSDPVNQRLNKEWPFWCYGYGLCGWLEKSDVAALLQQLAPFRELFSQNPETEKGLELQPITAYHAAMRMLTSAKQANCGLFLAIVD